MRMKECSFTKNEDYSPEIQNRAIAGTDIIGSDSKNTETDN